MMNTPDGTTFNEVCDLILAQLDALESPETPTPEQLLEFQGRSEQIRVLCEQLDERDISPAEEQLLESIEMLENVA
jgi:hypothetical protein